MGVAGSLEGFAILCGPQNPFQRSVGLHIQYNGLQFSRGKYGDRRSTASLRHKNIVTIYDIVHSDDSDLIVMEHIGGKTLADLVPKGGLRVPQVIRSEEGSRR